MVAQILYFHPYLGKWSNLTNKYVSDWKKGPPRWVFFLAKQPWYSPRSWYHDSWLMSGFSCCITLDKGTVPYPHTQPCPVKICRSSFPGVFFLLGPILPKARNSTHEKMKLPKGKLYSNHRFVGEQREKITWLFTYAGKYNYLSYVGIIIHHYKDPY